MENPTAVILAAGFGSRLMPLTADRPKALVEVAGRPILDWLLSACADAGLSRAVVVTGYAREALEGWLRARRGPMALTAVYNPEFDTLGNAWSLHAARTVVSGDIVKLDGDLIVGAEAIRRVVAAPGSAAAIDTSAALDAEAMKAQIRGEHVSAFGKGLPVAESHGESIGIEKLSGAAAEVVFDAIAESVKAEPQAYYEDVYSQLIAREQLAMAAVDVGDLAWTEIDDASDFARAAELLAPS